MENRIINIPNDKEGLDMNATAQECGYLNLSKLRTRVSKTISTEEALQDAAPINWSKDVLEGKKMILVSKMKEE